jgi:hypothetical protein
MCLRSLQRPAFGLAQHAALDRTPCREGVARFVDRGLDHVPALARAHLDEAARLQLHQGLAHQRAADAEQVGQCLLAQALARRELLREDRFDDALGNFGLAGHGCDCRSRPMLRRVPARR